MGLATLETLNLRLDRIQVAKRRLRVEEAEQALIKLSQPALISGKKGRIQNMWMSLEELLFSMSKADGKLSMDDFWKMNVYEFYRYKQLLTKHLKKQRKRE